MTYEDAKSTFWHSSAHILGAVIEDYLPNSLLTTGPATKEGFFYDFYPEGERVVHEEDYSHIEKAFEEMTKARLPFERLVVSKNEALEMFNYN